VKKPRKAKKASASKRKPSKKAKQLTTSLTDWAHELVESSKAIKRRGNADLN
jgi:hypothetical protein